MERAKEFTKSGNKQAAMQCLKRKKYYESQMNQVGSVQLRINTKEKMIADHSGNKEDKWNQSSECMPLSVTYICLDQIHNLVWLA